MVGVRTTENAKVEASLNLRLAESGAKRKGGTNEGRKEGEGRKEKEGRKKEKEGRRKEKEGRRVERWQEGKESKKE